MQNPLPSYDSHFVDSKARSTPVLLAALFLGVALFASACTATKFENTWKDPSFQPGSYKRVLVVGIGKKPTNVGRLERAFAENLTQHNASAMVGAPLKPRPEPWNEAELRKVVADQNADAVLLSRLRYIDKTEKEPAHTVAITGASYDYYGYYYDSVTLADSPEPITHEFAVIETKLFDAKTGKPVWSAKTRTSLDNDDTSAVIKDFAKAVTAEIYASR
jgi:hypothetical protein